jgi:hypothetical protein
MLLLLNKALNAIRGKPELAGNFESERKFFPIPIEKIF